MYSIENFRAFNIFAVLAIREFFLTVNFCQFTLYVVSYFINMLLILLMCYKVWM